MAQPGLGNWSFANVGSYPLTLNPSNPQHLNPWPSSPGSSAPQPPPPQLNAYPPNSAPQLSDLSAYSSNLANTPFSMPNTQALGSSALAQPTLNYWDLDREGLNYSGQNAQQKKVLPAELGGYASNLGNPQLNMPGAPQLNSSALAPSALGQAPAMNQWEIDRELGGYASTLGNPALNMQGAQALGAPQLGNQPMNYNWEAEREAEFLSQKAQQKKAITNEMMKRVKEAKAMLDSGAFTAAQFEKQRKIALQEQEDSLQALDAKFRALGVPNSSQTQTQTPAGASAASRKRNRKESEETPKQRKAAKRSRGKGATDKDTGTKKEKQSDSKVKSAAKESKGSAESKTEGKGGQAGEKKKRERKPRIRNRSKAKQSADSADKKGKTQDKTSEPKPQGRKPKQESIEAAERKARMQEKVSEAAKRLDEIVNKFRPEGEQAPQAAAAPDSSAPEAKTSEADSNSKPSAADAASSSLAQPTDSKSSS